MRKLFVSLVTALVLLAVAPAVSAGGWKDQPGELTVTVDAVAETYTYHGTGFVDGQRVYINECRPGCTASFLAKWFDGTDFDKTRPFGFPGTYEGWAITLVPVGNQLKVAEVDRVTFTVP